MVSVQRVTPPDLKDREAVSYFRFSSKPQEKGSTIDRQEETLVATVKHFGLTLNQRIVEKAMSASKGHHRTRGKLRDFIDLVREGRIKRGTVLVIESIDRLFREGLLDVFPILSEFAEKGLILVTGQDREIWCEARINDDPWKLVAEIQTAQRYTARLAEMARGAHARRRKRLFSDEPSKPQLHTAPPAWIVRAGKSGYALHPERGAVVAEIFRLSASGWSCIQIADDFNRRAVPTFIHANRSRAAWASPFIARLLRNRAAIGFVQLYVRDGTRRKAIGDEVRIYPAAVDDGLWVRVRDGLDARKKATKGRRGKNVANLFTSHVFCKTCDRPMRSASGGTRAKKLHSFVCSGYLESKVCPDSTRYDVRYYEPRLLHYLMHIAPRLTRSADEEALTEALAAKRLEIQSLTTSIATLAPRVGISPALADQVEAMAMSLDRLRKEARDIEVRRTLAAEPSARRDEVWAFMKRFMVPAIGGNVDARLKLRALLAGEPYRITGNAITGGMTITVSDEIAHDVFPADDPHN